MSRLTRTAAAFAVATLAVAGLAGCGTQERLGSAAVIDGHQISVDELQTSARAYQMVVPGSSPGDVQRAILEREILSRIISAAARNVGVHASAAAVAKARDGLLASVGGRSGLLRQLAAGQTPVVLAPSTIDRWFKDQVLYRRIAAKLAVGGDPTSQDTLARTTQELIATGRAMEIHVNPRYGTWRTRTGVQPLVSGGLSRTAAEIRDQG
ncbi:MAG: hypothetical protein ABI807_04855 [Sporichthyaceae bacterium]